MTDLVFEFTSTAPEMEKAASAALKRLQESALKTATILSGAGKSSAKDLRKMVDEMEGAAGGSVEALSNMASRMEQRANSFRKNATDLKNTALGQAKALRDAAKQLQDAAAQIGAVNLPKKGASAASIKAFTDQFTSAAKQFESAVADVGSATASYIKFDKQLEDRLKKKKPKVDLGQDGMKEALKGVDKNADNLNFRISQLAKWQAEYDALYRKTYEKLGEGVSYKSIKADDLLPIDTLAEYKARGVQLGAIDKELWAERQGTVKLNTEVTRSQIAKQKAAEAEKLASHNSWIKGMQTSLSGWQSDVLREEQRFQKESASKQKAAEAEKLASHNSWIKGMQTSLSGWQSDVLREEQRFQKESASEQKAAESAKLAKQKEADQERLALQRQGTAERMAAAKADRLAELQATELQNQAVLRLVAEGIGEDYKRDQRAINGPTAGEIATSTRQARDRADELARSLRGVTLEANTLHSASRGLASGFNMLWLTWGEMLPLLAGAAISFGTAFSVKMGAQVDHTLQTIRVLSGETQEAIAGLNDQLLQLASTGPVGPLEVAEAMKTLSLAGMSAGDVSVAIRDVMNFAVAGTIDLKQAADVMTSVATAFNVTATGFNYVGDVIAKTAAVSKASVESVGEAFKTASVIHKQFGVSLEDAGVGIAALANLGIQGTAAGTALRNMYTDLSGRTPKVTKAMNELGLELRDQSGKFKDLVTLTMEFDKGLSRLDGTAQKNALLTILSERGGKPMIELRELVIEEEKVAREFAKRSGQAVVEGFEEGVKNRLQRMRDSIGDGAGFQIKARIELSETPLKQMETAVSALQSSLVSAFSSVKSEASGVALALQDLFRSDSFRSNIESLLQLTLNLAGGLVSLAKFANENAGALATLTAAYVGLRLAVGHSLELMTFYTKAQTLATTRSWAATAAVTAERVAQGPLAVQKAIATSATQADTMATWANTGAKYAAITASKLFAAALPYVGVVLAVATGAWMLYESVVGSSTKKMEDAAESSAHGKMIGKLNEETARLNENTDAMLANMTVEQLRLSRGQGLDGSKLGKHKELISAEENLAKATARRLRAQETADGTDDRVAVTMLLEGQAKDKLAAEQENARLISKSVRDATTRTVNAANLNAEVTKKLQEARQSAAKTGTDKFLAEQQRQLSGLDRLGKGGTAQQAAQNALDNELRYNRLDEIAKANKTELDGLRSRLNSEAEALKDFRDANMVQEGEYQSRITSITLEGEKAQKAAAISGWLSYAAEIDRLLTGLSAMPKSQISDNDKANRVQELHAKLRTQAEEFNSDMAKIDEEANKRERRLATDQYKELDKLRKANETAIANSKDRVQAIRDEQEMADKTLGLGGADLEATQARLKIELEAKKELRKFDLESIDKIQARDRLRADAELATDDETWEAKHRRADDFDAQLRILAKGRTALEVQLQTEAAVTVAAVYRKEFRQRVESMSNALSDGIVDALLTGGREGGDRLRAILEKQLVSEPFTLVVKALIQPFTTAVASGMQSMIGSNPFGAASGSTAPGSTALSALSGASSLSTLFGGSGVLETVSGAVNGFTSALTAGAQSLVGLEGTTAQMVTSLTSAGHIAAPGAAAGASAGSALASAAVPAAAALVVLNALGVFRKTKQVGTGLSGTIGASSDIDTYAHMRKSGTLFRGPKHWKKRTDSAELTNVVNQSTSQIIGSTKAMADALGMDASAIASYTLKIDEAASEFKQDGMTAEQVQAKFAQILSDQVATYAEGVAGQVNGIQSIQKVGETAQEALSRAYGWWSAEQQAQIAILNAQGKGQEALNRQRELDIALLVEDEKASRRRVFALEDQVAAETEAANLQQQLNEATMTRTELLALERAQILPVNQALFDKKNLAAEQSALEQRLNEATMTRTQLLALERAQILPGNQALFDQITLAEEQKGLQQRLNEATMTRTQLLALERAQILPGNQALFDQVVAAEAAKESQQQAADTAQQAAADTLSAWKSTQQDLAQGWLDGAQKMQTVRYEAAQRELDAARQAASAIASARTSAAQASIDAISGIAGALTSAREALTGAANQPLTATSYNTARRLIDQAAAAGDLNQAGLEDALKIVSGDTKTLFGRFEDWAMAQASAAVPVSKLDAQAQSQMAAAQAIIDTLKMQEDEAALRYDAEKRNLDDNHASLMDSLQMQYDAQIAQIEATQSVAAAMGPFLSAITNSASGGAGGGGQTASQQAAGYAQITSAISGLANQLGITYGQAEVMMQTGQSPSGVGNSSYDVGGRFVTAPIGSAEDLANKAQYDTWSKFLAVNREQGVQKAPEYLATMIEQLKRSGGATYTLGTMYQTPEQAMRESLESLGWKGLDLLQKLPGYAVGTPYVPQDGPAFLHKGEMVVPAAYNPNATGYSAASDSNAEIVAELRAVRAELEAIKSASNATAGFTAGTDRQLRRVIKSDAITTETV